MLFKYINKYVPNTIRELHLFSDGCPGQNKNHTLVRFLLALAGTNRFNVIHHYFPIRGHSFLPNDRDFGCIKRKIKKHDRIYEPTEYAELIKLASTKFDVEMLKTDEVLDFNNWLPNIFKKSYFSVDLYGKEIPKSQEKTFSLSNYMHFKYASTSKGTVETVPYIGGFITKSFKLMKSLVQEITLPSEKAYRNNHKIPINPKKIENLRSMITYIPEHLEFYNNVLQWPTVPSHSAEDDDSTDGEN